MSYDDDDIIIDRRWMSSGWRRVLPEQATALHMLVTTAGDRDFDGSLDDLVAEFGDTWFDYFTGGLDSPVRWIAPADAGRRRAERKGREARRECVTAFHAARRPMPSTVRELATTMADLRIFEVDVSVPRWRSVHWPPLPDEVLPMSERFREAEDWRRWSELHDDTARHISELLAASGPDGELILTSVEELEAATGCSDDAIRAGLEVLTRDEATTIRLPNGEIADTERLPSWAAFLAELHFDVEGPAVPD